MDRNNTLSLINGKMKLKIVTKNPEQLLNIFWKRSIKIGNVRRENLYAISLVIKSEYLPDIEKICEETNSKLVIEEVGKILKLVANFKVYITFISGLIISFGILFFLSLFIWKIDIKGDKHISPYEIRQVIGDLGITRGILKSKVNTEFLEEQIIDKNKNVLWSKVRIQGSTLQIEVVESLRPPVIEIDNSLGTIIADKDGEVVRVYTQSGTPVVKPGDIVKKGDLLIDGYQGKEGGTYEVAPIGSVIAKTFLEFEESVELEGVKSVNTKNKETEYYIEIFGKKLYFKKYKGEFENFEKINYDGKFIKKNIYYEVNKSSYTLDPENVKRDLVDYYTKNVRQNLKDTDSIVGILVNDEIVNNKLNLKISFVIEQDIGTKVHKTENMESVSKTSDGNNGGTQTTQRHLNLEE